MSVKTSATTIVLALTIFAAGCAFDMDAPSGSNGIALAHQQLESEALDELDVPKSCEGLLDPEVADLDVVLVPVADSDLVVVVVAGVPLCVDELSTVTDIIGFIESSPELPSVASTRGGITVDPPGNTELPTSLTTYRRRGTETGAPMPSLHHDPDPEPFGG